MKIEDCKKCVTNRKKVIVSSTGEGFWKSSLNFNLPMWLVAAIAGAAAFSLMALLISPQFAARVTLAIIEIILKAS
jgi:hypothetical protein